VIQAGDTLYLVDNGIGGWKTLRGMRGPVKGSMCSSTRRRAKRINLRGLALLADTVSYHTEPSEAADLARSAGVQRLVLSHLTLSGMPEFLETFTREVEKGGQLNWHLAQERDDIGASCWRN